MGHNIASRVVASLCCLPPPAIVYNSWVRAKTVGVGIASCQRGSSLSCICRPLALARNGMGRIGAIGPSISNSCRGLPLLSRRRSASLDQRDAALSNVVRCALASASLGRPQTEFIDDVERLRLAGATVGEKYLACRRFPRVVEHLGALTVAHAARLVQETPLGSLGIPSDISLFFDSATIGKVYRSVRSTVEIIGIIVSNTSARSGSCAMFIDAPCEGIGNRGDAKLEDLLWILESSPHGFIVDSLRRRLAIVSADGQYADGEQSRHAPSTLLASFWQTLRRVPRDAWNAFHRINISGKRAMATPNLAQANSSFTLVARWERPPPLCSHETTLLSSSVSFLVRL